MQPCSPCNCSEPDLSLLLQEQQQLSAGSADVRFHSDFGLGLNRGYIWSTWASQSKEAIKYFTMPCQPELQSGQKLQEPDIATTLHGENNAQGKKETGFLH